MAKMALLSFEWVGAILIADEDFRVGERASEDEKCIAFFTASQ
jgi:hypothetical protein